SVGCVLVSCHHFMRVGIDECDDVAAAVVGGPVGGGERFIGRVMHVNRKQPAHTTRALPGDGRVQAPGVAAQQVVVAVKLRDQQPAVVDEAAGGDQRPAPGTLTSGGPAVHPLLDASSQVVVGELQTPTQAVGHAGDGAAGAISTVP